MILFLNILFRKGFFIYKYEPYPQYALTTIAYKIQPNKKKYTYMLYTYVLPKLNLLFIRKRHQVDINYRLVYTTVTIIIFYSNPFDKYYMNVLFDTIIFVVSI